MKKPEMTSKQKIVIIVGPTGVGKSAAAVELARCCRGEVINADAMQVYRHMDIGTAKPSPEERRGIEHHLMDVVDPDEPFNAALFARLAAEKIREISARGRRVILAGGTGLYIKALTKGLFKGPGADPAFRAKLRARMDRFGVESLYRELHEKDAEAAARIHPNDSIRIIRALEVLEKTGRSITAQHDVHGFREQPYATLKIGLTLDRKSLYDRINARCGDMIVRGLVDEARKLLKMGYRGNLKPMQALGYKQILKYLNGEYDLPAALEEIMRETRRYAKRQLTWFGADPEIEWHCPDEISLLEKKINEFFSHDANKPGL